MDRRAFFVGALALGLSSAACKPKRSARPVTYGGVDFLELEHPEPDATLPPLVAIHGSGGAPEHWVPGFAKFPGRARILLPRGFERRSEGFAWFPGDTRAELVGEAKDLTRAANRLAIGLRALGRGVLLTGYAEGAMLAFALAAQPLEVVLGSFLVAGACPRALYPTVKTMPVTAYHGAKDDLIPIDAARASIDAFKKTGAPALLREYSTAGHDPSDTMHEALNADIEQALEATRSRG